MVSEEIKGFDSVWDFIDFLDDNDHLDDNEKRMFIAEAAKFVAGVDDWSSIVSLVIIELKDLELASKYLKLSLESINTVSDLDELYEGVEDIAYDEDDTLQSQWFEDALGKIERKKNDPHVAIFSNLFKSFKYNQRVYTDRVLRSESKPVHLPTIPGPTGVGKTTLVRKFASEMNFNCVTLEGGALNSGLLLATLHDEKEKIMKKVSEGVVVLIERFNQIPADCQDILKQYTDGDIDAVGNVVRTEGMLKPEGQRFKVKPITELFIVGEITT